MRQEASVRLHPSLILSANARLHWAKKAEVTKTLVQFGRLQLGRGMEEVQERVNVTFEFRFQTNKHKPKDRANLHPTVKALLDGIVRAGVLYDDSDLFIDGPDIVISDELSGSPQYVIVKVVLEDVRSARAAKLHEAQSQIMQDRDIAAQLAVAKKREARQKAKR